MESKTEDIVMRRQAIRLLIRHGPPRLEIVRTIRSVDNSHPIQMYTITTCCAARSADRCVCYLLCELP